VFHTLHCVNAIRMSMHRDYYNGTSRNDIPHLGKSLHRPRILEMITDYSTLDHCLDAIRQYVQCAGITTLVPTKWREGARRNYIDSDQVHTCRSFTYLREWATSRRAGGPAYVERDRTIIDMRKNKLAEKKMGQIVSHAQPPS
jgi:hypothetical protein